jgi:Dullard-like phosphatase family protein
MSDSAVDLLSVESQIIAHSNARSYFPRLCCFSCCPSRPAGRLPLVNADLPLDRKVLVLDLDETLVHCTFQQPDAYDFIVSIPFDGSVFEAYVQKRPFVDDFLREVLQLFQVVIFTASLSQYANPIIDLLCPSVPSTNRMFREHCTFHDGYFIKDLGMFNRPLSEVIIVDNNPSSFMLHPDNAILSQTWEGNPKDSELMDVIWPILSRCAMVDDVRQVLAEMRVMV